MPKASPIQDSFNAGELSPKLEGRVNIPRYRNGCQILENLIPSVHGSASKRPGIRFVNEVKTSADSTVLIPFEFNTDQAYMLEFGDQYMRVYFDNSFYLDVSKVISGVTATSPTTIQIIGHPYSNGDSVYISGTGLTALDGLVFNISNVTVNTFDISADGTGWVSGGTVEQVFETTTPYSTEDLAQISYAQSADVLYLAHPSYRQQTVIRRLLSPDSKLDFIVGPITFDWPPFIAENAGSISIYASASTGTGITLTASSGVFTSNMELGYIKFREIVGANHDEWAASTVYAALATVNYDGNVYRTTAGGTSGSRPPVHLEGTESDGSITDWLYLHSGEGYAQLITYSSNVSMTANVISHLPDSVVGSGGATKRWAFGSWSDERGYPGSVCFYEDRLIWAGNASQPQTLWGSVVGDYANHKTGTADDDSFQFTLNSDQVNVIEWINPGKALMIGTAGGEFVMSGSTLDEAITPTNVRIIRADTKGSKANVRPTRIGNKVLFIQRSGRKVREIEYVLENDGYRSPDLSLLAEHIPDGGIIRSAWQQEPDQLFWMVTTDGKLICMTYDQSEQVIGWHRHPVGGDGIVESIAAIPHPDGDQDQLWMIVKRTINGATKRYVEFLEKEWRATNDIEDAFFVDSGLTYDGVATTTITGLNHLEGQTVAVLADGSSHADKVVSSGAITLDRAASVVQVGLGYNSTIQTMRFEAGAADGTAQGKTKRITDCAIRLYQTGPGLWIGPDTLNMEEIQFRDSTMAMDQPVPLFNGDKGAQAWPTGYEKDARVTVQHRLPLPCTVTAIMPQLHTQDR